MAKKLFGSRQQAAAPVAAPAEKKGPIITPLDGSSILTGPTRRKSRRGPVADTILSDKLGA